MKVRTLNQYKIDKSQLKKEVLVKYEAYEENLNSLSTIVDYSIDIAKIEKDIMNRIEYLKGLKSQIEGSEDLENSFYLLEATINELEQTLSTLPQIYSSFEQYKKDMLELIG